MNNPNKHQDEFWEQIADYEENLMDIEQRVSFEQRLLEDGSLREMLYSWRVTIQSAKEWYETPAKGKNRIDSLPIPSFSKQKSAPQWYRWLSKAAIFVVGFGLGIYVEKEIGLWYNSPKQPAIHSQSQEKTSVTGVNRELHNNSDVSGQQNESKEIESKPSEITAFNAPHYTQQADGKFVIETKMQKSGAQAVLIVDGNFELPKNKQVQ